MDIIMEREKRVKERGRRNVRRILYDVDRCISEGQRGIENAVEISDKHGLVIQSKKLREIYSSLEEAYKDISDLHEKDVDI